jgi:hypothetical protein
VFSISFSGRSIECSARPLPSFFPSNGGKRCLYVSIRFASLPPQG